MQRKKGITSATSRAQKHGAGAARVAAPGARHDYQGMIKGAPSSWRASVPSRCFESKSNLADFRRRIFRMDLRAGRVLELRRVDLVKPSRASFPRLLKELLLGFAEHLLARYSSA